MMSGEAWLYLFAVIINAVNLFLQVFFTIMYSDLEWYVSLAEPRSQRFNLCCEEPDYSIEILWNLSES